MDIHILPILCRRILTDSANVIPFNLFLLRSPEPSEPQHCLHLGFHIISRFCFNSFRANHVSVLRWWGGLHGFVVAGRNSAAAFLARIAGGDSHISTSPGPFFGLAFSRTATCAISAFTIPFPGLGTACTTVVGVTITGFGTVSARLVVASAATGSPAFFSVSGAGASVFAVSVASFRESWSFPLRGCVVVSASPTWGPTTAIFCI